MTETRINFVVDGKLYTKVETVGGKLDSLPDDPTKNGYIFDGWYFDEDEWKEPLTAEFLADMPDYESISVFAKWVLHPEHEHTPAEAVRENEIPAGWDTDGSYDEVVYCSVCGIELSRTAKLTPPLGGSSFTKYYDYTWKTTTLNVELSEHTCSGELGSVVRRYLAGDDPTLNDPIDEDVRRRNLNAGKVTKTEINYRYVPDLPDYSWGKNVSRIAGETESYSSDSADVYVNFMYDMVGASLQGAFANLKSTTMPGSEGVNYFSFTESDYDPVENDEGYMYDLMSSLSFSTKKMYVLASDYLIDTVRAFFVVPVNIEMVNDIDVTMVAKYNYDGDDKFDIEDFFTIIGQNEWNYEAVKALSGAVAKQVGEKPSLFDDTHGFALGSTISGIHGIGILYGTDVQIIQRKLDPTTGYYNVSYPAKAGKYGEIADAIADLFRSQGVTTINNGSLQHTPSMMINDLFSANQMLLGGVICAGNLELEEYQEMNSNGQGFGVVPVPMWRAFDESIDIDVNGQNRYYRTAVHSVAKVAAISASTTKFRQVSAWLDYQTTHSSDILEQYYEEKLQYSIAGNNHNNIAVLSMLRENVSTALDECYDDVIRTYAGGDDVRWCYLIRQGGSWENSGNIRTRYTDAIKIKAYRLENIRNMFNDLPE